MHATTIDLLIDVRCSATLGRPDRATGRCQLMMGHEGQHAVMFSRGYHRVVRTWSSECPQDRDDHEAAAELLPWMRGFPVPAWAESV